MSASSQNTGTFLGKNGQITNLAELNAAFDSNDRGQVAGTSTCGNSTCASIWDNGSLLTQFGANAVAQKIDNFGLSVLGGGLALHRRQQRRD